MLNKKLQKLLGPRLRILVMAGVVAAGSPYTALADEDETLPPAGAIEINAPEPAEISGVAAVPGAHGGYAVIGDSENNIGWIWPGGAKWRTGIRGVRKRAKGLESVDIGIGPNGQELWLVLGEKNRTLSNLYGHNYKLPKRFKEKCGLGLEGLSVRWNNNKWQVAVLWEGGYFDTDKCDNEPRTEFVPPRVAVFEWAPGFGGGESTDLLEFELKVPNLPNDQRFGAPDLTWLDNNSDKLIVLLNSTDKSGSKPYDHTWLQVFDFSGNPAPEFKPYKLEKEWGEYRADKNWEALDQNLDQTRLVMGFDSKNDRQTLVVFPSPFRK